MYGKNPVAKLRQGDGNMLKVVKIFATIQGEGPFSGHPAVFIRLNGCNLRCHFCDTEFSQKTDPMMTIEEIRTRVLEERSKGKYRLAVITGGEPTLQPLDKLIAMLQSLDMQIQLETNGLFWQQCLEHCFVVVSPKTVAVNPQHITKWSTFKYIIKAGQTSEEDGLPLYCTQTIGEKKKLFRPPFGAGIAIYLSPMDEYDAELNKANRAAVSEIAQKFGYIAGVQLHKIMEVE